MSTKLRSQPTADDYVSAKFLKQILDVPYTTLQRWVKSEDVKTRTKPGTKKKKKREYRYGDVDYIARTKWLKVGETRRNGTTKATIKACYIRISPTEPPELGVQQEAYFALFYPQHRIYKDIGFGHEPHRAQFKKLMDDVYAGKVIEIVVMSMDRLGTFGIEYIEQTLLKMGVASVIPSNIREYFKFTDQTMAKYLEANLDELFDTHRTMQHQFIQKYNQLSLLRQQEPAIPVVLDNVEMSDVSD